MKTEEFKEKFNTILMNKLNVGRWELRPTAEFTELGADSLDMVDLVLDFEKAFFISIHGRDVEKIKTIGEAEEYLKAALKIN